MSLIKCPECGKEFSDKANSCPNCGIPTEEAIKMMNEKIPEGELIDNNSNPSDLESNPETTNKLSEKSFKEDNKIIDLKNKLSKSNSSEEPETTEKKESPMGILSLILSCLGCLFIFGFVCAIADLYKNDPAEKHWTSKAALAMCVFWIFVVFLLFSISSSSSSVSSVSENSPSVESIEISSESEMTTESSTEELIPAENAAEEFSTEEPSAELESTVPEIAAKKVFGYELDDNRAHYVGDIVQTSFPISSLDEEDKEICSSSDDGNLYIYPIEYDSSLELDEYITVVGKLGSDENGYDTTITDAKITETGEKAQESYEALKAEYEEAQKLAAEKFEEEFRETAQEVTYDELSRYPDKYKSEKIKLTVNITDVEPEKYLIFAGYYKATFEGKEITVYDERDVKEPKLLDGDTVTIYGYGNGLTTVKQKRQGLIFDETVNEYTIPSIAIKFLDF